jgi:hypothetical protein
VNRHLVVGGISSQAEAPRPAMLLQALWCAVVKASEECLVATLSTVGCKIMLSRPQLVAFIRIIQLH